MNNGRRIGLIMIITGATLWGLSDYNDSVAISAY